MPPSLAQINADVLVVKRGLRAAGVPDRIVNAVATRALRSQRRQTGQFQSNRASRWTLDPADPQFGPEADCKIILIRLLGMMLEFDHAPVVDDATRKIVETYLGKPLQSGTYRDPLTLEVLDYALLLAESQASTHGVSSFHLGHDDPTAIPKHSPQNISWRSARSNLLQGDLTLAQARAKFVELIARYFKLGEVQITPE